MPYSDYPHKKEPGYLTSRRCNAPCGGWIVIYDRKKGGPKAMKSPISATGRYVIMVRESNPESKRWVGIATQAEAKQAMKALAKGENVGELLPATFVPRETFLDEDTPSKGTKKSRARVRVSEKPSPNSEAPEEKNQATPTLPPPRSAGEERSANESTHARQDQVPDALRIQRILNQKFDADRIASEIEEGLRAEKSYVTNGEVVVLPDHATRVKYLDLLCKYRIGIPDKREKPQEPKRVSYAELQTLCVRSPAARRRLRQMIDDAEKEADSNTTEDE